MVEFCEEFKREVIDKVFTDYKTQEVFSKPANDWYCWTPRYMEYWEILRVVVDTCDMLGIEFLEIRKPLMAERVTFLNNPEMISTLSRFESWLDYIKVFKKSEKIIAEQLQLLNKEETRRLNEALNCYVEGCDYSAVAMSVSAIEFRLFSLMMSECPNPKLEELTLGQLIREYLDDKKKYSNVIPKKHEPLLEHCNTYRIFSVHPKREKVTRPIATSIINMTFIFLLDKKLKHKIETR